MDKEPVTIAQISNCIFYKRSVFCPQRESGPRKNCPHHIAIGLKPYVAPLRRCIICIENVLLEVKDGRVCANPKSLALGLSGNLS